MDQRTRTKPATAQDFHRLADLAHQRGLRVFEVGPNRWFCTSHSDAFKLHVVTGFSCDCQGFVAHARCSHHAALLAHFGWLPEIPFIARTPADCAACCGCGVVAYRSGNPAIRPAAAAA